MKRDVVVAICVGFVLGVVVAILATNLPQIIKNGITMPSIRQTPSPTPNPTPNLQNLDFTIESPQDGSVSESKTIEIAGIAKAGRTILIESEGDQIALEASESGRFSAKLNLREGANTFYLTNYDENGNLNTKTLNVYFTSEKL